MSEPRSTRTEIEAVSRLEYLVGLLGKMTQRDPSPGVRERLSALAAQRLREDPGYAAQVAGKGLGRHIWFKRVFPACLLAPPGLAGLRVVRFRAHEPVSADRVAKA